MPDKKLQEFDPEEFPFDEEEEEQDEIEFGDIEEGTNTVVLCHCKPVYNFQSIEFDMEVNVDDPEQIDKLFAIYGQFVRKLQEVAVDQPKAVYIPPKEPLASDKQKEVMSRFGIKFTDKTTQKEAQKLINDNLKRGS